MTQIVVGVRLNADGSGLVGQLRLSRSEMDQLRAAEKGASDAARDLSRATEEVGKAQSRNATVTKQAVAATAELTRNVGLQRAGWQQVGFQVQDVFASYASGSRLSVIFAQQSGQLASAIALIAQSAEGSKGKLAGLASFLGGGWGIAIGIAVSAGSALVSSLLSAADAADKVQFSTSGVADSQSILASVMDITTGKMKVQTEAALGLAFAQAQLNKVRAQADAARFREQVSDLRNPQRAIRGGFGGGVWFEDINPGAQKSIAAEVLARYADPSGKAGISPADAVQRLDNLRKAGALTEDAYARAAAAVANLGVELENVKVADATLRMLGGEGTSADRALLLKPNKPSKPKKDRSAEKAAREAERLANFGDRSAEAIAQLSSRYDTAPRDIDEAAKSSRALDKIIGDINDRLAKSKHLTADQRAEFIKIRGDAERLKPIIQDSLVRPFLDMLAQQQRQIDLGKLQVAGRVADADALQLTYSLMDKVGVEHEDQLATALAQRGVTEDQVRALYDNLDVLRLQTQEMRVQQQVQQMFLSAVADMRENVRLTLEDLRRDGPKALGDFAKRSLDVFDRLFSEVATEKLFGNLFRDLEDQLTGGDQISKAGDKLASAVAKASRDVDSASSDILKLGRAASQAAGLISGVNAGDGLAGAVDDPAAAGVDIVVTGRKDILGAMKGGFAEAYAGVFDDLKSDLKSVFNDIFGDRGPFTESLGKVLGQVTANAQIGATAGNLVTDVLGIKGSQTVGAIGGAIGGAIAGPIGSIVGGTLGSIAGGLFKKTKTGAATITSVDQDAVLSGNSSSYQAAAGGAASSVQDGLARIADMLGASIGAFNVTIGQRHGDWRVREGSGSLKIKKGATEFDDDQAGAIAYAIQLAVSQGAVTGLSAAMDQALRSSPDIDKAIAEALKVQEVEQLLGGLGAEMAAQFKAFETQAKERLRIATQYGFDVVEIEKKNAEDRAKLVDQILTDRVGSLQTLLDDMKFGNLAEGSLADQRTALLAEIAKAQAAAQAGEEGAADKLASLSRSLIELSREAYGTAGDEYGADRDNAIAAAEAVIKAENDRIKAAQDSVGATNTKLDTANQLAEEQVQYLAEIASSLAQAGLVVNATLPELNKALVAR
ncbi:hypothetical protein [Sphingobium sp.]|uniref:hypothetical protein n=1 Tax=Sphingobium sp. TaxID=1912891 RepID=UPI00261581CB|nr:hypothetical protein [Sphingobium sp.]